MTWNDLIELTENKIKKYKLKIAQLEALIKTMKIRRDNNEPDPYEGKSL